MRMPDYRIVHRYYAGDNNFLARRVYLLGIDQSVKLSVTEKRSLFKKIIVFRSYNSLYDETCLKLFHSVLFRQRRNKFYAWRIRENFFMPFFILR